MKKITPVTLWQTGRHALPTQGGLAPLADLQEGPPHPVTQAFFGVMERLPMLIY